MCVCWGTEGSEGVIVGKNERGREIYFERVCCFVKESVIFREVKFCVEVNWLVNSGVGI